MKTIATLLALSLAISVQADVLHLTSGKDIKGTVTTYANSAFEITPEAGSPVRQMAGVIKSIEFTPRPVKLEVRGRNEVEGNLTAYENGAFVVETASGKTEKVPTILLANVDLGGNAKKFMLISGGGQVDMKKLIVPGKITVVDFFAEWCGPCRMIGPQLERLNKEDNDIVLRKVDIVRWGTPVTKQFNINGIPRILIYDRKGNLAGTAGSSIEGVRARIKAAKIGAE